MYLSEKRGRQKRIRKDKLGTRPGNEAREVIKMEFQAQHESWPYTGNFQGHSRVSLNYV
jgi:hypothetical protein